MKKSTNKHTTLRITGRMYESIRLHQFRWVERCSLIVAAAGLLSLTFSAPSTAMAAATHPAIPAVMAMPAGHLVQTANGPVYSCAGGWVVSESDFYGTVAGGVNNPVLLKLNDTNWCSVDDGGGWYLVAQDGTDLCWAEDVGVYVDGWYVNQLREYTCSASAPWEKWGVQKPTGASTWLFYDEHDGDYLTNIPDPITGGPDADLAPYISGGLSQDWTN